MLDGAFRLWMTEQGQASSSVATRMSDARRVEKLYGDLDVAFDDDGLASILTELTYSAADRDAGRPNPSRLSIEGSVHDGLASYRAAVAAYGRFRKGSGGEGVRQADRIRSHVLANVVEPARARGEQRVEVVAGEVHRALGLDNAMPAVCSALGGKVFEEFAGVRVVDRQGPPNGSTVRYAYALSPQEDGWAEAELRSRYGAPTTDTKKMLGFELEDGRAIALQRDASDVRLWIEEVAERGSPPARTVHHYLTTQARHSNLPARLRHAPPGGLVPRTVAQVVITAPDELRTVLDWYSGSLLPLDRMALERLRLAFMTRFPDFVSFEHPGGYGSEEDEYKRRIVDEAVRFVVDHAADDDATLGGALLDLAADRRHNLLGHYRTYERLKGWRARTGGTFDEAAGALVRSRDDPPVAAASFVAAVWPVMVEGLTSRPYGDGRIVATLIAALVRPEEAVFVRTVPFNNAGAMLLGKKLFGSNPLTAEEYAKAIALSVSILAVMRDLWGWAPRDLWDVQGFLWCTCQSVLEADVDPDMQTEQKATTMPEPTNVILYGPPGTGKTYATRRRAVELCGEDGTGDPATVKAVYERLADAGRIRFVTFHQSYSYEDFVEGLRPTNGGDGGEAGPGFRLEARPGVFREIAALAQQAFEAAAGGEPFDVGSRQVFKMSLGRAGEEDYVFDGAIEGGYVVLGWGGKVDWTPFTDYDSIHGRWNEDHPGTSGNDGNISQVWRFRCSMRKGDLVVVSYGNSLYRAIGEVTGDYEYVPTGGNYFNHRRSVRWLYVPNEPLPITFYAKPFTMRSCYLLKEEHLHRDALALLLPGTGGMPTEPKRFVLICDEINRANVSKVFGELITLLEADKRIGAANELRVALPYSKITDFGVPRNLSILGTMNTADRSIALLDTALRRRFDFEELMPDAALLGTVDGIDLGALLTTMNDRIEYLFDREHQIGHAYFMQCSSADDVADVMRYKVIPLLQEYFYEDWTKVGAVLGDLFPDDGRRHEGGFLIRSPLASPFGSDGDDGRTRYRWTVRSSDDFDCARVAVTIP